MRLSHRVTLLYLLLALALLLAGYAWIGSEMRSSRLQTWERILENDARLLSTLLEIDDPRLDDRVDRAAEKGVYRITVVSLSGQVRADSSFSGKALASMDNHLSRREITQAAEEGMGSSLRFSTSLQSWLLYVALPLPRSQGFLRLAIPLEQVEAASPRPPRSILFLMLLLTGIGMGMVVWIFRRASRQVKSIRQSVLRLGEGEFAEQIPVSSGDEFDELARSIAARSEEVQDRIQELESEKLHLMTVLNSMSEGVLVADHRGRIMEVNPVFHDIFQVGRNPVGRLCLEVVRDSELQAGLEWVVREKRRHQLRIHVSEKSILARLAPILDQARVEGVVVVFHDITQLRRLETVRRDFISNVSHELKTPLTSIRGFAETLLQEETVQGLHRDFLEKINRNAEQLAEIITELFTLARLEGREEPLERKLVHFDKLMQELEKDFAPRLQEGEVSLLWSDQSGGISFWAGEGYLKRIFHNLIQNALQYSGSSEIRVKVACCEKGLLFSVEDRGVGIAAPDLERIFERFYRVHKDRSRATGGTGIGLALVKHMVEVHGGEVWAESEPGKGTRIFFTLPQESGAHSGVGE